MPVGIAVIAPVAVGTVVTITNSANGAVTDTNAQTSHFTIAVVQDGTAILPEISTVDTSSTYTIIVNFYVDGILKQTATPTNSDVFRLISGFIGRMFEIEIIGAVDVDFIGISQTPMDISL